ncbi:MAG: hypothetical protein JXN61_11750 [Sedimentisphaerales bacterium]|nr:hypothetical protein [Sedimentisphaerales bacterium]
MMRGFAILMLLPGAWCGLSASHRVWYNPERTLDQAKEDIERCYYEAFLTEQGGAFSSGFGDDRTDPLVYVEMSVRQCMKQSGYGRVRLDELGPAVRGETGFVHRMPYFLAGR